MYTCVCVCECVRVCVCPCGTQTLVLQGDNIFYNKTTVNVNPIGHNDWISLPPQRWWQWFLRCLLVTDKFLNKIIRFGALQSALLDYWLSTKISCPADVWVCGQHSKWAKTALSGRGKPPKPLLTPSAAEGCLWAPTCRLLQCRTPAVPKPWRPRKQGSSPHCPDLTRGVALGMPLSLSESAFSRGKGSH